ncbi:MAG: cell division protein FtsZ [Treponema sp.]|jgi:cell division protein FtsZ|nr:cell division protein FtsZ [Treponema sp.]
MNIFDVREEEVEFWSGGGWPVKTGAAQSLFQGEPERSPLKAPSYAGGSSSPEADSSGNAAPRESCDSIPVIIKVIGTGGGGSNAVDRMIESGLGGVTFIAVNTDVQDLNKNKAENKLQIGVSLTGGRGAGGDPARGKKAAEEDRGGIQEAVSGAHMVFITAGMGGGTGTGSAPVIAQTARDAGALTVGVVTKPFTYEGRYKMSLAEEGIKELRDAVDALIIIPNEKVICQVESDTPLKETLLKVDEVLRQGIEGISEMITKVGVINIDFADVLAVMKDQKDALMGIGYGQGKGRGTAAAAAAVNNPLLEGVSMVGAKNLLVNVIGGEDLSMLEVKEIMDRLKSTADDNVRITHGVRIDPEMGDRIKVTVVATGFKTTDGNSRADSPEAARTEKKGEFISSEEWSTMYEKTFLAHRNACDGDIDVPTIIRDRKQYARETPEEKPEEKFQSHER